MSRQYKKEIIFSLFIIIFSIVMVTVIIPIEVEVPEELESSYLSPAWAPSVYAVLLGILGAAYLVFAIIDRQLHLINYKNKDTEKTEDKKSDILISLKLWTSLFIFVLLFKYIGILLSSILFMLFITFYCGKGSKKIALILSIVFPVIIYLFFNCVADVVLPAGLIFEYFF